MTDLHHERAATVSTTTVFSFHPARTNLIFPNCRLKWICIFLFLVVTYPQPLEYLFAIILVVDGNLDKEDDMGPGGMFLNSSLARVITHVLARVFLHVLARALLHVLAHSSQQFGLARVFLHVLARVLLHVRVQCANLTRCKIVQRVQ